MPDPDATAEMPPCCDQRDSRHVTAVIDPDLGLEHGERDALNGDPLPHDVPGTGGRIGFYTASPDAYCLCGHPGYSTCMAYLSGGGIGGAILYDRKEV
jgi:hypothetical protein